MVYLSHPINIGNIASIHRMKVLAKQKSIFVAIGFRWVGEVQNATPQSLTTSNQERGTAFNHSEGESIQTFAVS